MTRGYTTSLDELNLLKHIQHFGDISTLFLLSFKNLFWIAAIIIELNGIKDLPVRKTDIVIWDCMIRSLSISTSFWLRFKFTSLSVVRTSPQKNNEDIFCLDLWKSYNFGHLHIHGHVLLSFDVNRDARQYGFLTNLLRLPKISWHLAGYIPGVIGIFNITDHCAARRGYCMIV